MRPFARQALENMFGLDYRSLALFRMVMAALVLVDVYWSAVNVEAFYTDAGALPRALVYPVGAWTGDFGLHRFAGAAGWQLALFALEAAAALLMLVGYRTRLATLAALLLLLSRQARNPLVMFGADMVLRVGLFWAVFLPLGWRFSLDAALGRAPPPERAAYLGAAGFALVAQIVMLYVFGALLKTGPEWQVDRTAVALALSLNMYGRPFGHWVAQFDGLTHALTVATLCLELYGPLLFLLPVGSAWARLTGIALFAALQASFGLCMQMGMFGSATVALTLPLLPAPCWNGCLEPAGRWLAARMGAGRGFASMRAALRRRREARAAARSATPPGRWQQRWGRTTGLLRDAALLLLVGYVLAWNLGSIPGHRWLLSPSWERVAWETGLNQRWDMFAPFPQREDGWVVLRGWLRDGRDVDLTTGASPADFSRPARVADTYRDECWASFFVCMMYPENEYCLEPFATYLARAWNRTHPPAEQLRAVEIIFMAEPLDASGARYPVEPEFLWTQVWE